MHPNKKDNKKLQFSYILIIYNLLYRLIENRDRNKDWEINLTEEVFYTVHIDYPLTLSGLMISSQL